jgi:hypothetical protein
VLPNNDHQLTGKWHSHHSRNKSFDSLSSSSSGHLHLKGSGAAFLVRSIPDAVFGSGKYFLHPMGGSSGGSGACNSIPMILHRVDDFCPVAAFYGENKRLLGSNRHVRSTATAVCAPCLHSLRDQLPRRQDCCVLLFAARRDPQQNLRHARLVCQSPLCSHIHRP